jgi:hypothetical protein
MVGVQTHVEASLNISLRSACFIDERFYLAKNTTSILGTTLKCQIIRISKLLDIRLRKCYCNTFKRLYYHTVYCGPLHPLYITQQLLNYDSRVFIINFLPTKAYIEMLQQSLNFGCSCEDFVAENDHVLKLNGHVRSA